MKNHKKILEIYTPQYSNCSSTGCSCIAIKTCFGMPVILCGDCWDYGCEGAIRFVCEELSANSDCGLLDTILVKNLKTKKIK